MADLGHIAYNGYFEKSGGKSLVSGAQLREWRDLSTEIQEAWRAAARAVVEAL